MACQYLLPEEQLTICVVPETELGLCSVPRGLKILELGLENFTGRLVVVRQSGRKQSPRKAAESERVKELSPASSKRRKPKHRPVAARPRQEEFDSDVSSLGLGGKPKVQKQSVHRPNTKGSKASFKRPRAGQAANAIDQFAAVVASPVPTKTSTRKRREEADNLSLDEDEEIITNVTSRLPKDKAESKRTEKMSSGCADNSDEDSRRKVKPTTDPLVQFGHLLPQKEARSIVEKQNILDEVAAVRRSPSKRKPRMGDSMCLDEVVQVHQKKKKAKTFAKLLILFSGAFSDFDRKRVNNSVIKMTPGFKNDDISLGESSQDEEYMESASLHDTSDNEESIDLPPKSPTKFQDSKYLFRESNAPDPIDQLAKIMAAPPPQPKQVIDEQSVRDLRNRIESSLDRQASISSTQLRNELSPRGRGNLHMRDIRGRRESIEKREAMSMHRLDQFAAALVSNTAQGQVIAPRREMLDDCSVDDTISQLSDPPMTPKDNQPTLHQQRPPAIQDTSESQPENSDITADGERMFLHSPNTPSMNSSSKRYMLDAFAAAYLSPLSVWTMTPKAPKNTYKDFTDDISWDDEQSVHLEHDKLSQGRKQGENDSKVTPQKAPSRGKELAIDFADDVSALASPL